MISGSAARSVDWATVVGVMRDEVRLRVALSSSAVGLGLSLLLAGCGSASTPAADTGSGGYWAVVALSQTTGHLGVANSYTDARAAEADAMAKCNADDCRVVARVTHGCAALAQAPLRTWGRIDYAWGYGTAPTKADAARRAVDDAQHQGAVVVRWVCTPDHSGPS